MDEVMLDLLVKEEALSCTLVKADKAIEVTTSSLPSKTSTRTLCHLDAIKTRVQEGLEEVTKQRVKAYNSLSLSEVMQTSV